MRTFRLLIALIGIGLFNMASAATGIDRVYAIVNDDVVTESEYEQEYLNTTMEFRARGRTLPEENILRRQILDRVITERLQLQVANQVGIEVPQSQIDQTINDIASRNKLELDQLKQVMRNDGINYEAFRQRIANQLKIQKLVDFRINNQVEVTDREVEEFLQAERLGGGLNAEFNVSHIIVPISTNSQNSYEQARQRIEQARDEILAGAEFAAVAARYSGYEDALEGGEIGWRRSGELPALYFQALRTMEVGEVSEVLQSESAYHLVRLNQRRSPTEGTGRQIVQVRLRQIYLKIRPEQTAEYLNIHLNEIANRLSEGKNFAELANQYSEDPASRIKGGDMGWIGPGDLGAPLEAEIFRMPVGQISQPMRNGDGISIFEVTDTREVSGDEVLLKNAAREQLHIRKAEQMYQEWVQELRDRAYIKFLADDIG